MNRAQSGDRLEDMAAVAVGRKRLWGRDTCEISRCGDCYDGNRTIPRPRIRNEIHVGKYEYSVLGVTVDFIEDPKSSIAEIAVEGGVS